MRPEDLDEVEDEMPETELLEVDRPRLAPIEDPVERPEVAVNETEAARRFAEVVDRAARALLQTLEPRAGRRA
jgi:hypothetical protein